MPFKLPFADDFSATFSEVLADWNVVTLARERFGSWEWQAERWPDKRRPRALVLLAVTPTEAKDAVATRGIIEAWAAAEMRERYTRRQLSSIELALDEASISTRREIVQSQLLLSAGQAQAIRPGDILSTYEPLEQSRPEEPSPSVEPTLDQKTIEHGAVSSGDWLTLFEERREINVAEAAEVLGQPIAIVLELAHDEVRRGRLHIFEREREIYLSRAQLPPSDRI